MTHESKPDAARTADRIAGAALIAAAAISMLAMAHHPTSAHAGTIGGVVHGTMIVLVAITAFGFAHVVLRRGLERPAMLAGSIAYGIGVVANIGAATINGFVVPALAAGGDVGADVFAFAWEANQALAVLGVFATGAAFVCWSFDFLGRPGTEAKIIGVAGLLAGIVPALLIAGGWIGMNVTGAFALYGAHAAWAALVGVHTARRGLGG